MHTIYQMCHILYRIAPRFAYFLVLHPKIIYFLGE